MVFAPQVLRNVALCRAEGFGGYRGMTQTKLEIIGPYTPEHEGPFCTRGGYPARVICHDRAGSQFPIIALVHEGEAEACVSYSASGKRRNGWYPNHDLMNAREVPVAREFWVISSDSTGMIYAWFGNPQDAEKYRTRFTKLDSYKTLHVREVLPGEGA